MAAATVSRKEPRYRSRARAGLPVLAIFSISGSRCRRWHFAVRLECVGINALPGAPAPGCHKHTPPRIKQRHVPSGTPGCARLARPLMPPPPSTSLPIVRLPGPHSLA